MSITQLHELEVPSTALDRRLHQLDKESKLCQIGEKFPGSGIEYERH